MYTVDQHNVNIGDNSYIGVNKPVMAANVCPITGHTLAAITGLFIICQMTIISSTLTNISVRFTAYYASVF